MAEACRRAHRDPQIMVGPADEYLGIGARTPRGVLEFKVVNGILAIGSASTIRVAIPWGQWFEGSRQSLTAGYPLWNKPRGHTLFQRARIFAARQSYRTASGAAIFGSTLLLSVLQTASARRTQASWNII